MPKIDQQQAFEAHEQKTHFPKQKPEADGEESLEIRPDSSEIPAEMLRINQKFV